MPELPDISLYIEALEKRVLGASINHIRIFSPFFLRSAIPPIACLHGQTVKSLHRIGKRIAFGFEKDYWLVLHLMIAGRLHWAVEVPASKARKDVTSQNTGSSPGKRTKPPARKDTLAALHFSTGTLTITEAGSRKRASLHVFEAEAGMRRLDPGGLEPLNSSPGAFRRALTDHNHTLKRALTDPHLFSGIGNAYSDEILHRARLSPVALTQKLSSEEIQRLHQATMEILAEWTARLRLQTGDAFPEHVTAFRPEMAVHGRFGNPCPVCGTKVQRIRYAQNETNYCPHCQTGGKLLADRSLSLLLKKDWPRTLEELEEMKVELRR